MPLPVFNKCHATGAQRVAHLRSRGLIIRQPNVAARKIDDIGYERLRGYFLSRRDLTRPGRPFFDGTTYQDVIELYQCDAALRHAIFPVVGQFEVLLRNSISEALSGSYGSHPYFSAAAFRDAASCLRAVQTFVAVYEKSNDRRAKHYAATYGDPILPPIWTMKEFLTFGATSRLLQSLSGPLRTHVAASFGVRSNEVFVSWVEALVDLRNICGHHDRLFNRNFQKQPKALRNPRVPLADPNTLCAILQCLDYLLRARGFPSAVEEMARGKLVRATAARLSEAGF